MPRAKETFGVQVQEQTEGETRLITVTIMAPVQDFLLTDLLRQRGAVSSIETTLKQAVRECVQGYLEGTEELVAGLGNGQRKGGGGTKGKVQTMAVGRSGEPVVPGNGERGGNGRRAADLIAVTEQVLTAEQGNGESVQNGDQAESVRAVQSAAMGEDQVLE